MDLKINTMFSHPISINDPMLTDRNQQSRGVLFETA